MSEVTLVVLYPQPNDTEQFNNDYDAHLDLLRRNAGIPASQTPFSVLRFGPTPDGSAAPYYQMFTMPFPSAEALQSAMASPGMREVAIDATRISTGGAPTILIGE